MSRVLFVVLASASVFACASNNGDLPLGAFAEYIDAGSGSGSATTSGGVASSSATTPSVTITVTATSSVEETTTATSTATTTVGSTVATSTVASTSTSKSTSTTASTSTSSSSSSSGVTWVYLYDTYLAEGSTVGDCDGSCHHHSECSSPLDCYNWIGQGQQGNLSGGGSNALFTWEGGGGWMPEDGPASDPQAEADFAAWVAAGSINN